MKGSKFSEEKMVSVLREADRLLVAQVDRAHGVTDQTIYNWRQHFGIMTLNEVKWLQGYMGKRKGVTGSLQAKWEFSS
ncbi:hypothetical protein FACS189460_4950 [Deltaproteobacteria bacterium]|nr:hypothetical protein FACS189460_4950 [Deltaproteobacteria bacterium]